MCSENGVGPVVGPLQPASSPGTHCIPASALGQLPLSFASSMGWEEGGLERRPPGDF